MSALRAAGANEPNESSSNGSVSIRRDLPSFRDVFLHMGHGNENPIPFNDRRTVPEGKVLVFFAEYGKPVKSWTGDEIWDTMATKPELFLDPYTKEVQTIGINANVRVYRPGDKMPDIIFHPLLLSSNGYGEFFSYPSGIYQLDFEKTNGFALPTKTPTHFKITGKDLPLTNILPGDLNKEYLHKSQSVLTFAKTKESFQDFIKVFYQIPFVQLSTIVDSLPDGIHYFTSCRLIKGQYDQVKKASNELYNELTQLKNLIQTQTNESNIRPNLISNIRPNLISNTRSIRRSRARRSTRPSNGNSYRQMLERLDTENPLYSYIEFAHRQRIPVETLLEAIETIQTVYGTVNFQISQNRGATGEDYYWSLLNELQSEARVNELESSFIHYFIEKVKEKLNPVFGPVEVTRSRSVAQQRMKGGKRKNRRITRKLK